MNIYDIAETLMPFILMCPANRSEWMYTWFGLFLDDNSFSKSTMSLLSFFKGDGIARIEFETSPFYIEVHCLSINSRMNKVY